MMDVAAPQAGRKREVIGRKLDQRHFRYIHGGNVMQSFSKLIRGVLTLALIVNFSPYCRAQTTVIHVDRNGSASPDGTPGRPYQLVEAGACRSQPNGTVMIRPGVYNETLTLNYPVTLKSAGPAIIGQTGGKQRATLKVITYNTHLFGGEAAGSLPTFADDHRANYIAAEIRKENADVVGLQEVWDKDLADEIVHQAGYPHNYYEDRRDEADDFLNSGLLLLSKYPLLHRSLTYYRDEVSISDCGPINPLCLIRNITEPWKCLTECRDYLDAFASKGFAQATIIKAGFQVGIFVTHTQAEYHDDAIVARRKQLEQLGGQIRRYRAENPGAEVVVMGDFNVIGEGGEYFNTMLPNLGLLDAFSNSPCSEKKPRFTYEAQNNLAAIFDNNTQNQRLDYLFYSHGRAYDVLPSKVEVRKYQIAGPITENGKTSRDLSDHYGIAAELLLWRNN